MCIHNSYKTFQVYYSKDYLETISDQEIMFVDVINLPSLLDETEWPWYIKDAGFVQYTNTIVLPKKEHHFELP